MLHLDDDGPDLAVWEARDILDDGRVSACPSDIADENSQPTAGQERVVAASQTERQELPELLAALDGTQASWLVAVPDDVPVRRMDPDKVEPAGQVVLCQVESFPEIASPETEALGPPKAGHRSCL